MNIKRVLAMLLALVLLVGCAPRGLLPRAEAMSAAEVRQKIDSYDALLNREYGGKAYWNAGYRNDSRALPGKKCDSTKFLKQKVDQGDLLTGLTGTPCPGTDGTHLADSKVGGKQGCTSNIFEGGAQCCGFARYFSYVLYRSVPNASSGKWKYFRNGDGAAFPELQPGDFVYYTGRSGGRSYNHYVIVYSVNGDKLTVMDANNDGHCHVGKHVLAERLSLIKSLYKNGGYVARFTGVTPEPPKPPVEVRVSWEKARISPSRDDTSFATSATANVKGTWKDFTFRICDGSGKVVASENGIVGGGKGYYSQTARIWYDSVKKELKARLVPGTAYTAQVTFVFNGVKYSSPVWKFSTDGANVTWAKMELTPTDNDLKFRTSATAGQTGVWKEFTYRIWDDNNRVVASENGIVGGGSGYRSKTANIWYDSVRKELKADLKPGHHYRTQVTFVFDGQKFTSPSADFWTTGRSENSWVQPVAIEGWVYGETPSTPYADPLYGQPQFSYSTVSTEGFAEAVPTEAGDYFLRAYVPQDDHHFALTQVVPFTILPRELTESQVPAINSDEELETMEIRDGDRLLEAGRDYTVTRAEDGREVTVTVRFTGNYTGTVERSYTVEPVPETLTLDRTHATMKPGDTLELVATVTPAGTEHLALWESDNPAVASVEGAGHVTAHAEGQAVITVFLDNGLSAGCLVTVEAQQPMFVDVQPTDYFYDAVNWAVANRITLGADETHFAPKASCIRKQVVMFLWRAQGKPEPASMVNPFVDVPHNVYEKAILWAYYAGITSGKDAAHFQPEKPCSREQIVMFLWRSAGKPEPASMHNPFRDVGPGAFEKAILWAVENGITAGYQDGTFRPKTTCTRAQIVSFLYRSSLR